MADRVELSPDEAAKMFDQQPRCRTCGTAMARGVGHCRQCQASRDAAAVASQAQPGSAAPRPADLSGAPLGGARVSRPSLRSSIHTLVALTAFSMLLSAWSLLRAHLPPPAPARAEWEYKIASYSDSSWQSEFSAPNSDGDGGWEIIAARRATSSIGPAEYECILKRRK